MFLLRGLVFTLPQCKPQTWLSTVYWSVTEAVTGIDISEKQLQTARRLAGEHGLDLTLIEGNAESTGLPDAAAISAAASAKLNSRGPVTS